MVKSMAACRAAPTAYRRAGQCTSHFVDGKVLIFSNGSACGWKTETTKAGRLRFARSSAASASHYASVMVNADQESGVAAKNYLRLEDGNDQGWAAEIGAQLGGEGEPLRLPGQVLERREHLPAHLDKPAPLINAGKVAHHLSRRFT